MQNFLLKIVQFFKGLLSESKPGDGSPSASRFILFFNAAVSGAVLLGLVWEIKILSEQKALAIIGAFALIVGALAAYIPSAYVVNKWAARNQDKEKQDGNS